MDESRRPAAVGPSNVLSSWSIRPLLARAAFPILLLGLCAWLFGAALGTDRSFVFRDAAHFYDPLYQHTAAAWGEGRPPLWNPLGNLGAPLAADSTSAVFYPGKLVFALPLEYAPCYKLYLVLHVLLAAAAAYAMARRWGARRPAAAAAGISYAFCGNVLFQYCNAVFLVGAAWLPLALYAADRALVERCGRWAAVLGAVLALMTLGGDPQASYHGGMLAAGYALVLWRSERRRASPPPTIPAARTAAAEVPPPRASSTAEGSAGTWLARIRAALHTRPALLTLAALSGMVLAAVQIGPSVEWSRRSSRAAFESPRCLAEIPQYLARTSPADRAAAPPADERPGLLAGLLGRPARGTHHEHTYYFSVGPWRLIEYVWPNVSGRAFPVHRRWIEALPGESPPWTPTLYMGLFPLFFALGAWRLRGASPQVRLASWAVLFAVLGSFGWYGLGWAAEVIRYALRGPDQTPLPVGPQVGGVYWLMTVVLPGYVHFRYPAKLLTVAALGLSLLAAVGWDRFFARPAPPWRRAALGLAALSGGLAVLLVLAGPAWRAWLAAAPGSAVFGPLDAEGARRDALWALLQTALLAAALGLLLPRVPGKKTSPRSWAAVLILAADLAVAQGWMLPLAPRELWRPTPAVVEAILADHRRAGAESAPGADAGLPPRFFRAEPRPWPDPAWQRESSPQRLAEVLARDRATLLPKFHLSYGVAAMGDVGTMIAHDFQQVLRAGRRRGTASVGGYRQPDLALLESLGVEYLIVPCSASWGNARSVALPPAANADDGGTVVPLPPPAAVLATDRPLPRAWIVRRVEWLGPLAPHEESDPAAVTRRTAEVLYPGGVLRDFRTQAVVEAPPPAFVPESLEATAEDASAECRIVFYRPERVEVAVRLARPGLLVLSDYYDAGWRAEVRTDAGGAAQSAPVLRTNRILRGVWLPAGAHRVTFRYAPPSVFWGSAISAGGWLFLAAGLSAAAVARRRRSGSRRRRVNPARLA